MTDPTQAFTLPSEARDFSEWHRGRPRFSVWAIAVDHVEVEQRLEHVRAALEPLLLPGYARQAHVTVHICGFVADEWRQPDDFTPHQLQRQVEAMQALRLEPFRLRIAGAFSFSSAACLAVHDDCGSLARLRDACRSSAPSFDATPFVPHVTAGLYAGAWPMAEIERRLQPLASLPAIDLEVGVLDWMSYDSRHIGETLRTDRQLTLAPRTAAHETRTI